MPLTPSFSASQTSGNPDVLTLVDTSTGSDINISERRIFLLQATNEYLIPTGITTNYIPWPLSSSNISLNVLSEDLALNITVQWVDSSGTVLYTVNNTYGFTAYNETFYYGLTQSQTPILVPNVSLSTNYYQNKMALRVEIDSGNQAIIFASDIYSAQSCYTRATYLRTNANFFF